MASGHLILMADRINAESDTYAGAQHIGLKEARTLTAC